jgi:CRP/FNR family cyclic AMP-dependent transcriptional regulator
METKLLHGVPLFEPLTESEIQEVASTMEIRQFSRGSVILNEGDESSSLYIILSGKVKIFLLDQHGEEIILNFLHQGDYFGEVSLFDNGVRSASVVTLEDSYFGVLKKQDFLRLMAQHPELIQGIMSGSSKRMRDLSDNVRSLAAGF